MPGPTFKNPEAPPVIMLATVVSVDPAAYSCEVITVHSHRSIPDVKFSAPVVHPDRGAGFNYMPQVDSMCYVCVPADGTGTFILGFVIGSDPDEGAGKDSTGDGNPSYAGERPKLEPGGMSMTTKDGNFLFVRRGGVIQLGASQMAQRVYIPIENIIRDYFQRYHAFSPIGELVWDHAQLTNAALDKGDVAAIVKFSCREKIQDKKMSVEVRVGHLAKTLLDATVNSNLLQEGNSQRIGDEDYVGDGDEEHLIGYRKAVGGIGFDPDPTDETTPGILSVTINPQGAGVKYTFQVDKVGNNFIRSEGHVHVESEKTVFLSALEGAKIQTTEDVYVELEDFIRLAVGQALVEILSNGNVNVAGNNIQLDAEGNLVVRASSIMLEAANITLSASTELKLGSGGASLDLLANASAWKDALANHVHPVTGVTTGPGAVTTGVAPVILPGAVITDKAKV